MTAYRWLPPDRIPPPHFFAWKRRWWTVTTPWNYHLPFRLRLSISVRWKLPRWLGGWRL